MQGMTTEPGLLETRAEHICSPLRINCPFCHDAIQVSEPDEQEHSVCPSCGERFLLDLSPTVSWAPENLPRLGKFQLLEVVGRGAFGTVYRATDTELGRTVAIKLPRSGQLLNLHDEERFIREGDR